MAIINRAWKPLLCAGVVFLGVIPSARAGVFTACFELEQSGQSTDDAAGGLEILTDVDVNPDEGAATFGLLGDFGADGSGQNKLFSSFLSGSPGGGGSGGGSSGPSLTYNPPTIPTGLNDPSPEWMPDVTLQEEGEGDQPPANQVVAAPEPATFAMYTLGLLSVATASIVRRTRRYWRS